MTGEVERRLDRAFAALSTTDLEDDRPDHTAPLRIEPQLPAPPPKARLAALATAVCVAATGVTLAFALTPGPPETPVPRVAGTAVTPPAPVAFPYELYTHCGIDEARIGEVFYEAVTPLHDGAHNPPQGWGNPLQPGAMTIVSDTGAVFRDDLGHEVAFRVRPGATAFKHLCR